MQIRSPLLAAAGLLLALAGCDRPPTAVPAAALAAATAPPGPSGLLDLAWSTASALPADPHLKNRSRLQAQVVDACLQLGQTARAEALAAQIAGWRRGTAMAELACHVAAHGGNPAEVERLLGLAEAVAAETAADPNAQDWPQGRIRARIARAWLLQGRPDRAAGLQQGLPEFELGGVASARIAWLDATALDAEADALDAVIATGSFDQVRGALDACAALLDRGYGDAGRRARLLRQLEHGYARLPVDVRVGLLLQAAGIAERHADRATAGQLLAKAGQLIDGARWLPEQQLPLLARSALLRHRLGDTAVARAGLQAAAALYERQRERIVDICRAGALRPLAEAWHGLGDSEAALRTYRQALEDGVVNPNSRPRAEDLVATCCSMAVHGFVPDAALSARLQQIHDGLGDPW